MTTTAPSTVEPAGARALDDFDPAVRSRELQRVAARSKGWPDPGERVNLHCHTFFSYNTYGFSPTHLAVVAREQGWEIAGTVDFDGLDSAGELLAAGARLGLKAVASVESRVFVPELAGVVINSPGEPGIAYHLGVGFPGPVRHPFLDRARAAATARLRGMVARVIPAVQPVELDVDRDVLPLTPGGYATERHVCAGLERRARDVFPDAAERAAFWQATLGAAPPEGLELQSLVRARLLKQGGVGYVQPDGRSFPTLAEMNEAVVSCGALPAVAWLDGTSDGERDPDRLLEAARAGGAAALNLVPDRNYTSGVRDERVEHLYAVVAAAERQGFPIVVGTELNAPGCKLVDDFESDELRPLVPAFLRGARIVYAHSVLQRRCGLGYLGPWARRALAPLAERNEFYAEVGRLVGPATEERLIGLPEDPRPETILARLG